MNQVADDWSGSWREKRQGRAPAGLIRTLDGRITYWSPTMEQRYGFSAQDALGQVSHQLLRALYWQNQHEVEAILVARQTWSGGLILHRADGMPLAVGNVWHLRRQSGGGDPVVTELHYDIVRPGTQSGGELADVLATVAHELSQSLTAVRGLIGGVKRAAQSDQLTIAPLDRGLAIATDQIGRASDILRHVRALGGTFRGSGLGDLHARFTSTLASSEQLIREAAVLQSANKLIVDQGIFTKQRVREARAARRQRPAAMSAERTPPSQSVRRPRHDVAELIRRSIVADDPGALRRIATALLTTPRAFLARLHHGARLNAVELAVVLREEPEGRLRHWLFGNSGMLIVRRMPSPDSSEEGPLLPLSASVTRCIAAMCDLVDRLDAPHRPARSFQISSSI